MNAIFESKQHLESYLFKIAINACRDELKHRKRNAESQIDLSYLMKKEFWTMRSEQAKIESGVLEHLDKAADQLPAKFNNPKSRFEFKMTRKK